MTSLDKLRLDAQKAFERTWKYSFNRHLAERKAREWLHTTINKEIENADEAECQLIITHCRRRARGRRVSHSTS